MTLQAQIAGDMPITVVLVSAVAGLFGALMTLVYKFFGLYEKQIDADKQKQSDAIQAIARSMEAIQSTIRASHDQQTALLSTLAKALDRIESKVTK